jgi:hypothetical protein
MPQLLLPQTTPTPQQNSLTHFKVFTREAVVHPEAPNRVFAIGSSTVRDLQGDVMEVSALRDMELAPVGLLCYLNHKYELPEDVAGALAASPEIVYVGQGIVDLRIEIDVEVGNPRMLRTYEMIKAGRRIGTSVGCIVDGFEIIETPDGPVLHVTHVRVVEWSFVAMPANQRSWVEHAAKGLFEQTYDARLAPVVRQLYPNAYLQMLEQSGEPDLIKSLAEIPPRKAVSQQILWSPAQNSFQTRGPLMTRSALSTTELEGLLSSVGTQAAEALDRDALPPTTVKAADAGAQSDRDQARAAQEARSKKYQIGVKDKGNVSKPGEWKDVPDSQFGDPVNYRYPMPDKVHADNAAAYWNHPKNRRQYNTQEQAIVTRRIKARQRQFGEDPKWDSAASVLNALDAEAATILREMGLVVTLEETKVRSKHGKTNEERDDQMHDDDKERARKGTGLKQPQGEMLKPDEKDPNPVFVDRALKSGSDVEDPATDEQGKEDEDEQEECDCGGNCGPECQCDCHTTKGLPRKGIPAATTRPNLAPPPKPITPDHDPGAEDAIRTKNPPQTPKAIDTALLSVYNEIGHRLGMPTITAEKCALVQDDTQAQAVITMVSALDMHIDVAESLIDNLMGLLGVPDLDKSANSVGVASMATADIGPQPALTYPTTPETSASATAYSLGFGRLLTRFMNQLDVMTKSGAEFSEAHRDLLHAAHHSLARCLKGSACMSYLSGYKPPEPEPPANEAAYRPGQTPINQISGMTDQPSNEMRSSADLTAVTTALKDATTRLIAFTEATQTPTATPPQVPLSPAVDPTQKSVEDLTAVVASLTAQIDKMSRHEVGRLTNPGASLRQDPAAATTWAPGSVTVTPSSTAPTEFLASDGRKMLHWSAEATQRPQLHIDQKMWMTGAQILAYLNGEEVDVPSLS